MFVQGVIFYEHPAIHIRARKEPIAKVGVQEIHKALLMSP
jgi:hypothetical protein